MPDDPYAELHVTSNSQTTPTNTPHPAAVPRATCARTSALLQLFAFLCLIPAALAQNTIHVPADQLTIQAGIDAAQNGDIVLVSPGTYNENIDFKGKAITVTSGAKQFSDAAATVINGSTDGFVVNFKTNEPASAVLNGFTVQGGHSSAATEKYTGGISISAASPTITNNIVTNNIGCGILVANGSNTLLQGNDILQNHDLPAGSGFSQCISLNDIPAKSTAGSGDISGTGLAIINSGYVQVIGNTIEKNYVTLSNITSYASAIFLYLGNKILLQNNVIRNNATREYAGLYAPAMPRQLMLIQNLFYENTSEYQQNAVVPDPSQIEFAGTDNATSYLGIATITFINNTVYGEAGALFFLDLGPSEIANNVFYAVPVPNQQISPYSFCAYQSSLAPWLNVHNDDTFSNGLPVPSGCNLTPGSTSADPQFLDPANFNFHTQPTSPIVAAGDINAPLIPSADLDGKARTVCGTIGMGVYEVRPRPAAIVTSSNNPSAGGTSVTFTARVPGNCNVPTGTVTFLDGNNPIGTVTLDAGAFASISTPGLTAGSHNITVSYPGDFNFDSSTSSTLVQVVTGNPTSSALTCSPNPATAGQTVTFATTVSSTNGTPTGSVTYADGSSTLATQMLTSGSTVFADSSLSAGAHTITASYAPTTTFATSSSTCTETINGLPSTTILIATPNPANVGQAVTLSTAVTGTSTTPTGTVTFYDGASMLSSTTLDTTGHATYTTTALTAGTHSITASYVGNATYSPSTSAPTTLIITAPATPQDFALTLASATLTVQTGHAVTAAVTLASINSFADTVSLTCANLPAHLTCTFTPKPATLTVNGTTTVSLTLNTASTTSGSISNRTSPLTLALLLSPASLFLGIGVFRRRSTPLRLLLVLVALLPMTLTLGGCGEVIITTVPRLSLAPGTYTIPITATGATTGLTHTTQLTLTVTP